jgi:hypothetical protein
MTIWERRLTDALRVAVDMRAAQQRYFKAVRGSDEKREALKQSVGLERRLDVMMAQIARCPEWTEQEF